MTPLNSSSPPRPETLHIDLGLPHSVNSLYFVERCKRCGNRHVRVRKDFEARAYSKRWGEAVALLANQAGFETKPKHPYAISGVIRLKDKRSDMPNRLKHLIDTVCKPLGLDDRYIAEIHFEVMYDPDHPGAKVEIQELPDWPEAHRN